MSELTTAEKRHLLDVVSECVKTFDVLSHEDYEDIMRICSSAVDKAIESEEWS